MMSYIISKVSQNTSGNSKYVDRADAIERFLQQKRDAKAAQRAQASNSNKETTNKSDKQTGIYQCVTRLGAKLKVTSSTCT